MWFHFHVFMPLFLRFHQEITLNLMLKLYSSQNKSWPLYNFILCSTHVHNLLFDSSRPHFVIIESITHNTSCGILRSVRRLLLKHCTLTCCYHFISYLFTYRFYNVFTNGAIYFKLNTWWILVVCILFISLWTIVFVVGVVLHPTATLSNMSSLWYLVRFLW